ncbi:MAG: shikimate dehydrogenase family protein [Pikeienuella sp.]
MITGTTRFAPILAHPCRHVRTPPLFNAECARRKLDMIMAPLDVRPEMLARTFDALRAMENLAGFMLTIPHKGAAAALCDRLTGAAEMMGVCNVVRRAPDGALTGAMFDGEGFVAGLRREGHEPAGRRILLIGAGGAAAGLAHALAGAGAARLTIANRSRDRAEALAQRLTGVFPDADIAAGPADPAGHDLIVNATSLGMRENDPPPVDPNRLPPGALAAEVVMQPDVTPFLRAAGARGHAVHKGVHMIEAQIRLLVDFLA